MGSDAKVDLTKPSTQPFCMGCALPRIAQMRFKTENKILDCAVTGFIICVQRYLGDVYGEPSAVLIA